LFAFVRSLSPKIYELSLHDALPISRPRVHVGAAAIDDHARRAAGRELPLDEPAGRAQHGVRGGPAILCFGLRHLPAEANVQDRADRKSTRLNSSHVKISYAVFCLKR